MIYCSGCRSNPCECGARYKEMHLTAKFRLARILLSQVRDESPKGVELQTLIQILDIKAGTL